MERRISISLVAFLLGVQIAQGQCCSGGVPTAGNLGLPYSEAKIWQMSLNYDLNVLKTLKNGTEKLEKGQRERTTHSVMWETAYAFTDKLSLNTFFSLVRQERTIREFGNENFVSTNGVGDAIILARYSFFPFLTLGTGVKVPLGSYERTNDNGNILSADLQPGSGAWDLILWATMLRKLRPLGLQPEFHQQ